MADTKGGKGDKGAKPGKTDKPAAKGGKPEAAPSAKEAKGKTRREAGAEVASAGAVKAAPKDYVARLKKLYRDKVVLNMGVGEAVNDTKKVTSAAADLALIAGQRPVVTRARRAISTFKVRENMPIGAKVTLRRARMYEFLDRLVTVALPAVGVFPGLDPKSFDGRGNYALGVKEHIIFPEIDYDKAEAQLGLDIVVCTTAKTDAEAQALLKAFNFPFRQ